MARTKRKKKTIAILTSGGDCPGLNAAIRGVAKAALCSYDMQVIGFQDGFKGLVENRYIQLCNQSVSNILTLGGTMLGSSREKLKRMRVGDQVIDASDIAYENLKNLNIDTLVCLGGGGTIKNAYHLHKKTGMNILSLPKTIDNDVWGTDITFGFNSALEIATEAIDRLHTTATSHHRIIVCEIMGHNAGWLALQAGIAGGADTILIPEIPYSIERVAQRVIERRKNGKRFSIIALSEGAMTVGEFDALEDEKEKLDAMTKEQRKAYKLAQEHMTVEGLREFVYEEPKASKLARELQSITGIDARVTSLGHVQRGGAPSAFDRVLCTEFGTAAVTLINDGEVNVMVAKCGMQVIPVPIKEVVGKRKIVPIEHPLIITARLTGVDFGD